MISYFKNIKQSVVSTLKGMGLTFRHFKNAVRYQRLADTAASSEGYFEKASLGSITLAYPHEHLPVPPRSRYELHNKMEDCIVCDKCAVVCPVDCIEIDAIKATEQIGTASNGMTIRLYAAKFDIDMAKCCFCGLCTVVCPTECLTMTPKYDVNVFDIKELNYPFSTMTETEATEKRQQYDDHLKARQQKADEEKLNTDTQNKETTTDKPVNIDDKPSAKPVFKPKFKKLD